MIWNPWKALRAAEQEVTRLQDNNAWLDKKLKEFDLRNRILKTELCRLDDVLAKAHFRNPKTGRIGKKGERFK